MSSSSSVNKRESSSLCETLLDWDQSARIFLKLDGKYWLVLGSVNAIDNQIFEVDVCSHKEHKERQKARKSSTYNDVYIGCFDSRYHAFRSFTITPEAEIFVPPLADKYQFHSCMTALEIMIGIGINEDNSDDLFLWTVDYQQTTYEIVSIRNVTKQGIWVELSDQNTTFLEWQHIRNKQQQFVDLRDDKDETDCTDSSDGSDESFESENEGCESESEVTDDSLNNNKKRRYN